MGTDATQIYHDHHDEHHVSRGDCMAMFNLAERVHTVEESKELNRRHGPMIIISASGMLAGGRVMHHVASFGPDPRNAIVLSGFQAGGTPGAVLAGGGRNLRLFGRDVEIKEEVVQLEAIGSAECRDRAGPAV